MHRLVLALLLSVVACSTLAPPEGRLVSSGQAVTPVGPVLDGFKRPVDLAATSDGRRLFVKDDDDLVLLDAVAFAPASKLAYAGDGASQHGLCLTADGKGVFATGAKKMLFEARVDDRGALTFGRKIELKTADGKDAAPLGVAALPDGSAVWICLSRENTLARLDLATNRITTRVPTGVCPWGVVIDPAGRFAFVSCFGGERARPADPTETSAGTDVVVDDRGIARGGALVTIDLTTAAVLATTVTGRHPSAVALSPAGDRLLVACAGADTVEVFAVAKDGRLEREAAVDMKLDPALPYGSLPDALAFAPDGAGFYAACSGQNAIAYATFAPGRPEPIVRGTIGTSISPHEEGRGRVNGAPRRLRNSADAATRAAGTRTRRCQPPAVG